jgi:hypothetical protein
MKSRHSIPWTELILFLVLAMFSCQKNDVDSNNKASVYPYTIITKHAWYYFENFDTSYTATNLSDTVSGFPQPPFRKIIPDLSNPCTLSTFYNFNLDGTFTSVDCNGNTKTLGVWRTLSDTSVVNGVINHNRYKRGSLYAIYRYHINECDCTCFLFHD